MKKKAFHKVINHIIEETILHQKRRKKTDLLTKGADVMITDFKCNPNMFEGNYFVLYIDC